MQVFLDNLKAFFETVSSWVWGSVMLMLLVGTGIVLTVMLKGLQFTMLGYARNRRLCRQRSMKAAQATKAIFPILRR